MALRTLILANGGIAALDRAVLHLVSNNDDPRAAWGTDADLNALLAEYLVQVKGSRDRGASTRAFGEAQ
jgi:hypothetical protein